MLSEFAQFRFKFRLIMIQFNKSNLLKAINK